MTDIVNFTPELRDRLRRAYDRACEANAEQFTFDGHDYLTAYAKHLLDYLDGMFGKARR
jgi:hypothetical protein